MNRWVLIGLVSVGVGACIDGNESESESDPDGDGPENAAGRSVAGDTRIRDLTLEQLPQVCRDTSQVRLLGSVAFLCEAITALNYDPEYDEQTCDEAAVDCQVGFEASNQADCERALAREYDDCDATVGMLTACVEENAAAVRPVLAQLTCEAARDQFGADRERIYDQLSDGINGPACQALFNACDPMAFEPEPVPFEPEPAEPEPAEPEPAEPEPAEPEPVEPAIFDTLIIFDDGSQDDGSGASGVDICGVSSDCASAISASLLLGGGTLCIEEGPGCSTNRTDASAVLDDGSACEPGSVPSDYASLGTDGQVAVGFDGSLAGCTITVVEFAGATPEAWEAYVCDSDDVGSATCLNNDLPVHSAAAGGEATFLIPAE